ncbi:MAG: hypothetical protein K8T10_16105 [Candidatus Eremiobacteraeota bacterium]|nr:hypothetical protein [Candidatus Eremiobacteraeota bacterium]
MDKLGAMTGARAMPGKVKAKKTEKPAGLPKDTVSKSEAGELKGVYAKPVFKNETPQVRISRVTPTKKSAASENQWSGINKPIIGTDENGTKVVFKHNSLGIFARIYPKSEMRKRDVKEVVASHIMKDEFDLPTVTYSEGYVVDDKGQKQRGIVCDFIEGIRTLETAKPDEIKNPDQAVEQSIVKGWMGDWDIIKNDSNVWLLPDNTAVGADFGFAIDDGITDFGVPNANEKVMKALSKSDNVDPIVNKIKDLSDDEIKGMVHRAGSKNVDGWKPELEKEFTDILIRNRDKLKKKNPFDNYYTGFHPTLKKPLNKLMYPLIFFTPNIDAPGCWKHPEVILDTLKALAGVYQMPLVAKVLGNIEERVIAWQDRNVLKTEG